MPTFIINTNVLPRTCRHGDHEKVDAVPVGHWNRVGKGEEVPRVFQLRKMLLLKKFASLQKRKKGTCKEDKWDARPCRVPSRLTSPPIMKRRQETLPRIVLQ